MRNKFTVGNTEFEYDDDRSWNKWKDVISGKYVGYDRLLWIVDNVLSFPANAEYSDVIKAVSEIERMFGIRNSDLKQYMKQVGRCFRGITVRDLSSKAMEYQILKDMKGAISISDLKKMDFLDVVFYRRMIELEWQHQSDLAKEQEAKAKAAAGKSRYRGRH